MSQFIKYLDLAGIEYSIEYHKAALYVVIALWIAAAILIDVFIINSLKKSYVDKATKGWLLNLAVIFTILFSLGALGTWETRKSVQEVRFTCTEDQFVSITNAGFRLKVSDEPDTYLFNEIINVRGE